MKSIGATDLHYSAMSFGEYRGVLITFRLKAPYQFACGAQSYLDGPSGTVVTSIESAAAATCAADLRKMVDTIKFG